MYTLHAGKDEAKGFGYISRMLSLCLACMSRCLESCRSSYIIPVVESLAENG